MIGLLVLEYPNHLFTDLKKALLTKLKNLILPNPKIFLLDTTHILTLIRVESKIYLLSTE